MLGAVCAVHVAANATPRFRVPWLPFLIVYACHAALRWRDWTRPGARRALWAPLAALLFVLWAAGPYFSEEAAEVGTRPERPASGSP